jgi:hypothetical protein
MTDATFASTNVDASYLVASVLVSFYAVSRFNTPRTVRSQTTRFQYVASCVAYVASCLGLLMLMTWAFTHKILPLSVLHFGSNGPIPDNLNSLDAALVAALLLTSLLPSFPVVRDFDAAMLRFFHRMGAIPIGAARWAQRMNTAQFTITDRSLLETKNYVVNSRLLPDALIDELQPNASGDKTRVRFTRSLVLYVALSNLHGRARFGADFPEDSVEFEKKMGSFFAQSVAFFALTSQLSERHLEPVQESIDKFRSFTLEAYEEIRLMLARVLLYSCNGDAEVADELATMGFSIPRQAAIKMPLNLLSLDIVGVVVLFILISLLRTGHTTIGKALAIGLLVSINHSIAAAFALLPKQLWNFADIRCSGERPTLAYLISGACALTVGLSVSFVFYQLRVHFSSEADHIMPFAAQCKWLALSTALAVGLAFACDDFANVDHEPKWLKWVESAGLAALMALIGIVVVNWLQIDRAALQATTPRPSLWMPVLLSASIGALFGATIPQWYRKTMREVQGSNLSVPPRALAAVSPPAE